MYSNLDVDALIAILATRYIDIFDTSFSVYSNPTFNCSINYKVDVFHFEDVVVPVRYQSFVGDRIISCAFLNIFGTWNVLFKTRRYFY